MIRKIYFLIFALFLLAVRTNGQYGNEKIPFILENLFDRITETRDNNEKLRLNDSIKLIIDSYAASDSVFTHRFENLRYLGQILSSDKMLKIITWNLMLQDNENRYFSYIIRKDQKNEEKHVYFLTGKNRQENIRTDTIYNINNWYGALYYSIQPFRKNRKDCYILLGYDFGNFKVSRKLIDVLHFSPEGDLILGLDCFLKDNETMFREVLEYSPEGMVSLRMENRKMIVFVQLTTITTGNGESPEFSGAGNSFSGYVLKKGIWRFVPDVDVRNKKRRS